jgi:hypothetical protein
VSALPLKAAATIGDQRVSYGPRADIGAVHVRDMPKSDGDQPPNGRAGTESRVPGIATDVPHFGWCHAETAAKCARIPKLVASFSMTRSVAPGSSLCASQPKIAAAARKQNRFRSDPQHCSLSSKKLETQLPILVRLPHGENNYALFAGFVCLWRSFSRLHFCKSNRSCFSPIE